MIPENDTIETIVIFVEYCSATCKFLFPSSIKIPVGLLAAEPSTKAVSNGK